MILKIDTKKYYKIKELFKKQYKSLNLQWIPNVELDNKIVDGWFSEDMKTYLLKLLEDGNFKCFTGNSVEMSEFLKLNGAIESVDNIKLPTHNTIHFMTQQDRYGTFIGADLINHYRVEELLREMPENFGIKWCP